MRARTPFVRTFAVGAALLAVAACGGSSGGSAGGPTSLAYAADPGLYRAGETIPPNVPAVDGPAVDGPAATAFSVSPALPAGLAIDTQTGVITGTPQVETPLATYTVTAANASGQVQAGLAIEVGAALPAAFVSLAPGFEVAVLTEAADKAAKMALLPDGRLLFAEVSTGRVRVIDPALGLLAAPYLDLSSVTIGMDTLGLLSASHQGLIGLALDPDVATNGWVYVYGCWGAPDQGAVLRFTDDPTTNTGTNQQTVLSGLPTSDINNGGEILFDPLGAHLYVSVGDAEDATNAQATASTSLAGKVLRYLPGTPAIPAPANLSGDAEWCNGLRNTFGMAFHPAMGGLFGGDNGGAELASGFSMDDELNLLQEGKNYEWGAPAGSIPGAEAGFTIQGWADVIVPTAVAWHTGPAFATPETDSLLLASYLDLVVRRFVMSGPSRADVDAEEVWAELLDDAGRHHPLDLLVDPLTGDVYLSTFSGVYRIRALG